MHTQFGEQPDETHVRASAPTKGLSLPHMQESRVVIANSEAEFLISTTQDAAAVCQVILTAYACVQSTFSQR